MKIISKVSIRVKTSLHRSGSYVEPLYDNKDVERLQELIKKDSYHYFEWVKLTKTVSFKLYPSGHVIGGAIVVLRIRDKPKDIYFCFSGDLGRKDGIILPPPEIVKEPIDYLFLESTYGGRVHPERDQEIQKLLGLIRTSKKENRRVIIPSFALERSQEVIYLLSYYMDQGIIPAVPIFLDSPLGSKITVTFADAWSAKMFSDQDKLKFNPFDQFKNPYLKIISEQKDSEALAANTGNYIVIAGAGMCDAGRVRGHLRANLSKPDTLVCLIGYMATNSLGRRLKEGATSVKMNGEEIIIKAKIASFDSFSAHADEPFLVEYSKLVLAKNKKFPKTIFLVHGEGTAARDLQKTLRATLRESITIKIPELNEEIVIK